MGLLAPDQRPEPATRLATPGIVAQRLANATRMISTADINVSGLCLERVVLRAIMGISAHAISLPDRPPRTGHLGHQCSHAPGRPILHHHLILSQTSAGSGRRW